MKEDVIKGEFGKSKGYKTTKQNPIDEESKAKALLVSGGYSTDIDERVDPKPLDIGQSLPEPGVPDNTRFPAANDAYSMMAQRLEESMGPQEQYGDSFFGGLQSAASGLTPESIIAEGNTVERQQKAAMDLAALQGKQKAAPRLKMNQTGFSKLNDELNVAFRNKKATEILRSYAKNRDNSKIKEKLGFLNGLYNKAKFWVKGGTKTLNPEEARAMAYYWSYVNSEIKRITGAQMSEPEARRLMRQMPDFHNDPRTFMDTWDNIMEDRETALKQTIKNYKTGGWQGVEGLLPQYEQLVANPYQRTVWEDKKQGKQFARKAKKSTGKPMTREQKIARRAALRAKAAKSRRK